MKTYKLIEVVYMGATNTRGSRIKFRDHEEETIRIIAKDYSMNTNEQVIQEIESKGYTIIGRANSTINNNDFYMVEENESYYLGKAES